MKPTPMGGRASRLAALAAVAMLALSGALAVPAFRGAPPPLEPVSDPDPTAVRGVERVGPWLVEAAVTLGPGLAYRIDIRLTRDEADPLPARIRPHVLLEMARMTPIAPSLALRGVGTYRAEGVLPMPGRWRFRVGFDEGFLDLVAEVSEGPGGVR